MPDELVLQTVDLPSGELRVLQLEESAELPGDEALELAGRSARENGVRIETAASGSRPRSPTGPAPAGSSRAGPSTSCSPRDVLYERESVAPLLPVLPRLASEAWIADPGRPAAAEFLEQAERTWRVETHVRGVVRIHRLQA